MCGVETRLQDWIESRPRWEVVPRDDYPDGDMNDDEIAEYVERARSTWFLAFSNYVSEFDRC